MAMSMLLRNAGKLNGTGMLKTARLAPLRSYTSLVAAQRCALVQPVSLIKNVQPLVRSISLSSPRLASATSNHTTLWTFERIISLALLGVIPAAFLFPSQALDALMAVSVVLHTHWGVEATITDYVRPAVVGNVLPKVAHLALIVISIASLGGLFYLIYTDIGVAKTVKKLWAIKGQ